MPVTVSDLTALKVGLGDDCAEILCSQPIPDGYLFAAVRLKSGKFAGVWETHSLTFDTLDALERELNKHELTLLAYGVLR